MSPMLSNRKILDTLYEFQMFNTAGDKRSARNIARLNTLNNEAKHRRLTLTT